MDGDGVSIQSKAAPLFRQAALDHTRLRLHGEVRIATSTSWAWLTYGMLAVLLAAAVFLAFGSYARMETVPGALVLDTGAAVVTPLRPGFVTAVHVEDGQRVAARAPLVQVQAEEALASGGTAATRSLSALAEQARRLQARTALTQSAASAERLRLEAEAEGLMSELRAIDGQITAQQRLVEAADRELTEVSDLAKAGWISRRDHQRREEALLLRRQQAAALEQQKAQLASRLAQARRAIDQQATAAEAQRQEMEASAAELAQRGAELEARQGFTLAAPVAGVVTSLTARRGQYVAAGQPLLAVVPEGSRLECELSVPSHAVGFLDVGQEVRLQLDAFPYQRFGTVRAVIRRISTVPIARAEVSDAGEQPVYQVIAEVARESLTAFGREQPLRPGMTLKAAVITERRSLFEWLFEPVLAVRRRA